MNREQLPENADVNNTPFENTYDLWGMYRIWGVVPAALQFCVLSGGWKVTLAIAALLSVSLLLERFWYLVRQTTWFARFVVLSVSIQLLVGLSAWLLSLKWLSVAGVIISFVLAMMHNDDIRRLIKENSIPDRINRENFGDRS